VRRRHIADAFPKVMWWHISDELDRFTATGIKFLPAEMDALLRCSSCWCVSVWRHCCEDGSCSAGDGDPGSNYLPTGHKVLAVIAVYGRRPGVLCCLPDSCLHTGASLTYLIVALLQVSCWLFICCSVHADLNKRCTMMKDDVISPACLSASVLMAVVQVNLHHSPSASSLMIW